jgi:NADH-quinone oxidoreductase subunit N
LLLLAVMGTMAMVISSHFVSFFVGLEILNIALYTLISYYRERSKALEAGIKYLILAAMSSAILLFGMALIYTVTGTLSFQALAMASLRLDVPGRVMLFGGAGLLLSGIGFKLALAPFHLWAPDVYEGASSPVSAFIATISKGAVVAVLLRFLLLSRLYESPGGMLVLTILAILSMLGGNLLALRQNNIKRMLAYSSIAHFGYLLVALISGRGGGTAAVIFYLTAYNLAVLAAFGLVTVLSTTDAEAMDIGNYTGLFWRRPVLACVFSIVLLSLAGIPLTAGFMGKFLLVKAAVGDSHWLLAFVLIGSSVVGLFYYLRFIVAMMSVEGRGISVVASSRIGVILLIVLGMSILWLGSFPASLMSLIQDFL